MKPRIRYAEIVFHHEREKQPLRIVGDAGIAGPHLGDGRLIPVVILDTTNRSDLAEIIRLHRYVPSGDVTVQWGQVGSNVGSVALILSFVRPAELVAIIEFDIAKHGVIVEQILSSRALYIQGGKEGDRIKHDIDAPKIILEIPDTGFRMVWDEFYLKSITARMRKSGLGRQQAKQAAKQVIQEVKRLGQVRVSNS